LSDLNTLIDVGRDPTIIQSLKASKCGLGKRPVEQVILTHSHFDHAGMLQAINENYQPKIYAHPLTRNARAIPLHDRQTILVGDKPCIAVHAPGHSEDSLCILCEDEHLLFSGDIPLRIYSLNGEFSSEFLEAFEFFVSVEIHTIYPGHGEPLTSNVPHLMEESLKSIRKSRII
jgi:glyoxylase-like metal-dependent hydrolase (beta-lactamase superfamily II)